MLEYLTVRLTIYKDRIDIETVFIAYQVEHCQANLNRNENVPIIIVLQSITARLSKICYHSEKDSKIKKNIAKIG